MITSDQIRQFDNCCLRAVTSSHERHGIGTLGERTLHYILKDFFEPDRTHHEQKIGRYVADIVKDGEIIEIQTRNFRKLSAKLLAFAPEYHVNVVFPIAAAKYISWLDPKSGEISERRKSPKKGKPWDILYELYALRPILPIEGVTFTLVFCDIDEFRLKNGYGPDKKRGSERYERIPTALRDILVLGQAKDFLSLIPDVADEFTTADFAKAAKMTRTTAGYAVRTLETLHVIERYSKKGNAFVYRRVEF